MLALLTAPDAILRAFARPEDRGQPDDLTVSSEVDKTRVAEGEPLTFAVTITGPIKATPRVALPSLEHFVVLSSGQSQQVNVRAGQMQLSVTLHYVLIPTTAGRQALGAVTVEHEGRQFQTSPIEIEVVAGAKRPKRPAPAPRRPPVRGGTVL